MHVEFIGHASARIEAGGASLLMDPWLIGKAFNDGWRQHSPPAAVDFSSVDYLWISHEHPDHFNVPTLRSIPEAERDRILVLYQRHASARVAEAIRGLGFARVAELVPYRWVKLTPGVDILCGSVGSMDSFLALRSEGCTVLNLNDCVLNPLQVRYVSRIVGNVDLLLTQFSFANWVGNESDERRGAATKIAQLRTQVRLLRPGLTVPFASFIYFCNRENERMNAWINTPERIQDLAIPSLGWMYPGDVWNPAGAAINSDRAIGRYRRDRETLEIDPTPEPRTLEELSSAASVCIERNRRHWWRSFGEISIHLHDMDLVIALLPDEGRFEVRPATAERVEACRYTMCSQVAWYSMAHTWGFNTTEVSGMYLDRDYAARGRDPFFARQNMLSTQVLSASTFSQAARSARFFWRKKVELACRYLGRVPLAGLGSDPA